MSRDEQLLRMWSRARRFIAPLAIRVNHMGRHGYHRGRGLDVPVTAYCVYRAKNVAHVQQFIADLPPGCRVHLHALDAVAPALATLTRSTGPGLRMPLLQGLIDANPLADVEQYLLIFDDDVTFAGSGGSRFPGLAARAGLDIAQPAHHPTSHASYRISKWEPLSTLRLTTFVEVGPVVLVSPRARTRVLPFPEDMRMGWGLDVAWTELRAAGLRLGVVDATPIQHHGLVQAEYDDAEEIRIRDRQLARLGADSPHDIANNVGLTWRPWQSRPKWMDTP